MGNKTFYFHSYDKWDNRGGVTIAIATNHMGCMSIGVAKCSAKDSFCKKTGRVLAGMRAAHPSVLALTRTVGLWSYLRSLEYGPDRHISPHWVSNSSAELYYNIVSVLRKHAHQFPAVDFDEDFCKRCLIVYADL